MHTVSIQTLGELNVRHNGVPVRFGRSDAPLLLAYLALFSEQEHAPEALAALLFPGEDSLERLSAAQAALWQEFPLSVRLLRGISVADAQSLGSGVGLASNLPLIRVAVDALDLEQALTTDAPLLGRREAAALLTEAAAALDRGVLPGFSGAWLSELRERFCTLFRQASVAFFAADARACTTVRESRFFAGVPALAESMSPASQEGGDDGGAPGRFYGRESELAALGQLLQQGERIISIVGLGGAGKSRLALELLQNLPQRFHGWRVARVALGNVTTRAGLLEALRKGLGQRTGDLFQDGRDPLGALCRALYEPTLLYLDNVEDAVREPDGEVVKALGYLAYRCPETVMLATSRCRIGLPEEYVFALEGLALPTEIECQVRASEELYEQYPALEMLDEALKGALKGGLASAGLAERAALLHRSGGLPLSIELLAARSAASGMLPDLKALPATASTPRRAIDWALDPLSEATKAFLTRLSVCQGAFTPEDAEIVTGEPEAAYRLTELDDAGLVAAVPLEGALYRLPAAVRDALRESLEALPDRIALEERHAAHYARIAAEGEIALRGPDRVLWLPRLRQTLDDILPAIYARLLRPDQVEFAAKFTLVVGSFLAQEKLHFQGIELCNRLLTALEQSATQNQYLLMDVRDMLARYQLAVNLNADAASNLRIVLPFREKQNDKRSFARTISNLAIALDQPTSSDVDHEAAWTYYLRARTLFIELGEPRLIAQTSMNMANWLGIKMQWSQSLSILRESVCIAEEGLCGDELVCRIKSNMIEPLYFLEEYDEGLEEILSVYSLCEKTNNAGRLAYMMILHGMILLKKNDRVEVGIKLIEAATIFLRNRPQTTFLHFDVDTEYQKILRCMHLKEIRDFSENDLFSRKRELLGF